MNEIFSDHIHLFRSVFKGREDVFARRWEKENKSGYMPAYFYDPYLYELHKMKGGTFQSYSEKSYLPLSDQEIARHLNGEQLIGLYPLLEDNTSWFIAADFDKENWYDDCRTFIEACNGLGIPAYLERSRSGKGGHVWIIFAQAYPANRSRKIILSILEKTGIFSKFDKNSSFDRLFPNQDAHSGKGLGNLIALPLYQKTWEQGNSCFIGLKTNQPYPDQWEFLGSIQRISLSELDNLYSTIINSSTQNTIKNTLPQNSTGKLTIALSNVVRLNTERIPALLTNFLKEELNFINSEFIIRKKIGKNTFGTERWYRFVEESGNEVIVPKGFTGRLIRFCRDNKIEFDFRDERKKLHEVAYTFSAQLKEHQQFVMDCISRKDMGVIVAPPGSGKTVIGLKIIADKKQPALIITHRKQIAEQWTERIQAFLGIPKNEIGSIGQGKTRIGKHITIAMIQSLSKEIEKPGSEKLLDAFGCIIVDECHHIPAETYRNTVSKIGTYFLYGLTATPFRKYNDGKLIFIHLGEIIAEVKPEKIASTKTAKIIIRDTGLDVPFNPKTDNFETLSKILVHDSARNRLILDDINAELKTGKKVVIITERKEHIESLFQYLKQSYETIALSGEDSESSRNSKWKVLREGNYQVLITTGQFFGEGTDLQNAACLFLVYPFSFKGKLIQYIGRVQRSEVTPVIYDYRDSKIDYLNKMFLKRNSYYRKIEKQHTLFDDLSEQNAGRVTTIEKKLKLAMDDLEFRFGGIAFKYTIPEMKTDLEYEIDNPDIRPEFEVLKPYFSRKLKSKFVNIEVQAEFEGGKLVSQMATSADLDKINRAVIESVKFTYVSRNILAGPYRTDLKQNLLDIDQLQGNEQSRNILYNSGEELLEDILNKKNYRHCRQLKYLAQHHDKSKLKISFVLSPFSFVFLLTGRTHFHIVLETLDTEEATYIWHIVKDKKKLKTELNEIDRQLNIIRNEGRQVFLETLPDNFSRIVHDYSDNKKGFVVWKDALDERIT